ncbi:hypothetical protein BD413DRAFT_624977 [Trametes elegans]|nr:hypothetical protein BD413DRAFT_624977 [Trametes elegans]
MLSLPAFLKMLTSNGVPPSKAMAVAGKIYRTHNTAEQLSMLTDFSLESAGIAEKDLRRQVLAAVRKAGYKGKPAGARTATAAGPSAQRGASASAAKTAKAGSSQPNRKRRRNDDVNELLPSGPPQEGTEYGSLEFNEILDEEAIKTKYTVVNRAPIMTAWAFVVAERLGFRREEALSIASVYTEMNAVAKGASLGLVPDKQRQARGTDASRTGSQPYVELMGRRCLTSPRAPHRPLYQTASGQWQALSGGAPVQPGAAFAYITRALRQTAPHIVGALRLLAASFPPPELNARGFALYAEFRPSADGWGQRAEVRCADILALRKPPDSEASDGKTGSGQADAPSVDRLVKREQGEEEGIPVGLSPHPEEPPAKKAKKESPEPDEYDAALDDDALFNDFDLSTIP